MNIKIAENLIRAELKNARLKINNIASKVPIYKSMEFTACVSFYGDSEIKNPGMFEKCLELVRFYE